MSAPVMPGLLVSVRDTAEAALALAGGVALIDVKEPSRGSLGAADPAVLDAVLGVVNGALPVSAALGELQDWPADALPAHLDRLSYVKWGMAGCRDSDWEQRWTALRQRIESASPCRVVMTAYIDWRRANAPSPAEIVHASVQHRSAVLLLDTWHKDGSSLLDWMSATGMVELCQPRLAAGLPLALAGGLGYRDIRILWQHLAPNWFAVRGTVCSRGGRTGTLDPSRVRQLVEMLNQPRPPRGSLV